jgi:hypothetical protein
MFSQLTMKEADTLAEILNGALDHMFSGHHASSKIFPVYTEIANLRGELLDHANNIWYGRV